MRAQEARMKSYSALVSGIAPDPYALNANCEPLDDRSHIEAKVRFNMLEKAMGMKSMEVHGLQIKVAMLNQVSVFLNSRHMICVSFWK